MYNNSFDRFKLKEVIELNTETLKTLGVPSGTARLLTIAVGMHIVESLVDNVIEYQDASKLIEKLRKIREVIIDAHNAIIMEHEDKDLVYKLLGDEFEEIKELLEKKAGGHNEH